MERINVTRPYLPDRDEFDELVSGIWDRYWVTNHGTLHAELQQRLQAYLGAENLSLFANGHLALEAALAALGTAGGEVITTPFTFISTTNAIVRTGALPVFCDIDPEDFTMDETKIEALITEKTKAILPVHIFGYPCHVEAIKKIADRHGLKLIYDAAHAFGVRYRGESLCLWGDVSMLSFHATKLFHTVEGGALVATKDFPAFGTMELLANYGIIDEEESVCIGGNAKMSEFHAAMGLANLKHVDRLIEERRTLTLAYRERLSEIPGIKYHVPEADANVSYNYAYFPILVDENIYGTTRDMLYDKLKAQGIHTRKYFYPLTYDFACYSSLGGSANTPVAKAVSEGILCLPIYNGLGPGDVSRICDLVASECRR